jgi:hypothetical protein
LDDKVQVELDLLAAMPTDVLAGIVLSVFVAIEEVDPTLTVGDMIVELKDGFRPPNPDVLSEPLGEAVSQLDGAGLLERDSAAPGWRITLDGFQALAANAVARRLARR